MGVKLSCEKFMKMGGLIIPRLMKIWECLRRMLDSVSESQPLLIINIDEAYRRSEKLNYLTGRPLLYG